jgi:hypothetical protein
LEETYSPCIPSHTRIFSQYKSSSYFNLPE